MERDLICITCPKGCPMKVVLEDKNVISVTGNSCPRGAVYAEAECTHPVRTVTSTVKAVDGSVVPVKTDKAIPREMVFNVMEQINEQNITLPAHIGDIVIANVMGTGANVVVTANKD